LSILRERGSLTSSELLHAIEEAITQRSLQTELKRLQKAGLIVAVGKGRTTTYRVVEDRS
jgi:predicted transcriptional regulator